MEKLTKDQLLELVDRRDKLKALIKQDPLRFWQPHKNSGQEAFVNYTDPRVRVLIFAAGNKSGKTCAGVVRFLERVLGRALWDRERRQQISYPVPCRGVIFAEDFETHNEVTLPVLFSWMPIDSIAKINKNPAGHIVEIIFENNSVVHLRTYEQGSAKAEGKDWDIAWCDEPPPRDLFVAVKRGLIVNQGLFMITATLVKEAWIYDEMENLDTKVFEGAIHDNVWIDKTAREDFVAGLFEDERQTREHGKPTTLVGLIYKSFLAAPPLVVPVHEIPENSIIIMGVDPHERKPCHIMYGYLDPTDRITWFAWKLPSGTVNNIFKELGDYENTLPTKPAICLMDPNRGKAKQIDEMSWEKAFNEAGYNVQLGEDNIAIGHRTVMQYIKLPNPLMRFTDACGGRGGPIYQMQRYSWDDHSKRIRYERSQKEKPKDIHKDFPDIIRYTAMAGLRYDDFQMDGYETDYIEHERTRGSSIRAYL